ncbi:plasmid stabilization protein [Pseudomonas akapageensis]|uniref:plasmid stabilization protein n=1 Tax=Pseudomonas akapageensis TaxID=2609961 RepID=UPI0015B61553|nr:plasmid stabilization protein [Pseudomonas akapageensis]
MFLKRPAVGRINFDDQLEARLGNRAALLGRTMKEEALDNLRSALSIEPFMAGSLVDAIRARIVPLSGIKLENAPRDPLRDPVDLGE